MARRRQRSPQEKKQLSLDRDTPLSAKYPKAFRKHWARKKAAALRGYRNAQRRAVASGDETLMVRVPARRVVRKWPQTRLREVIVANQERRAKLRDNPRKSAAARARRRARRGSS